MRKFGLGQAVARLEDRRFVTGHGRYLEDIRFPHEVFACFVRSPHAHAFIKQVDLNATQSQPGVLLAASAEELRHDRLGDLPCEPGLKNADGSAAKTPTRPLLAKERVRHVGDPVILIVAESQNAARDAADQVLIDYEMLPAVTDPRLALAGDAPQIWPGEAPGNLCVDWATGDAQAVADGFAQASHIVDLELVNNRIIVNPMETRGAIGLYDPAADRMTLYASTQGVHSVRESLADDIFHVPHHKIRVITPDVGGGFGMKMFNYVEYALVLWAARRLKRPVRWQADRTEGFLSDSQGRDHISRAQLALDKDGRFLALKVETWANLGGYLSGFGPYVPTSAGSAMIAGAYRTPAIHVSVKGVFTNTVPTDAYRGAGRPEAIYLIERIVDKAARQLGMDPAEIRRRNFIPASDMPFKTALGKTYDSGDFPAVLDKALNLSDRARFMARRADAASRGKKRGMGIAYYVEACGGGPEELAELRIERDGSATLSVGTQSNGQGHHTAYAQIIHDTLGIPLEAITLIQGDTDRQPVGRGTAGSRSVPVGGNAVLAAAKKTLDKAKKIAAQELNVRPEDLEVTDNGLAVIQSNRYITWFDLASCAYNGRRNGADEEFGLQERSIYLPAAATYPNGCHIAEVEIDPETGRCDIVAYTVVDDFGRVINPDLLLGQIVGGTAQGIGQALHEHCVYDPQSGQLLSGSLMDYGLPRAFDIPPIRFETHNVPCTTNPLGIKGAGEAGAIGAPPAVINAIIDALAADGVTAIDMPATPFHIWQALRTASRPA